MEDSQQHAALVALAALGYDVTASPTGARGRRGRSPTPSTDELTVGDTITAVDGTDVREAGAVVGRVLAGAPGTS